MNETKKILHIEDNFENRILVRRLLQAEDFDVIEQKLLFRRHSVCVSTLPPMPHGFNMQIGWIHLTAKLKTVPALSKFPIIAITACNARC